VMARRWVNVLGGGGAWYPEAVVGTRCAGTGFSASVLALLETS
jgi:hypothetical protein